MKHVHIEMYFYIAKDFRYTHFLELFFRWSITPQSEGFFFLFFLFSLKHPLMRSSIFLPQFSWALFSPLCFYAILFFFFTFYVSHCSEKEVKLQCLFDGEICSMSPLAFPYSSSFFFFGWGAVFSVSLDLFLFDQTSQQFLLVFYMRKTHTCMYLCMSHHIILQGPLRWMLLLLI